MPRNLFTLLLLLSPLCLLADDSDTVQLNYSVAGINNIEIDAENINLSLNTPNGSEYIPASNSTSYTITSNAPDDTKKLTAAINQDMPADLRLSLTAAAPSGATSTGRQNLSTTAADLVMNIDSVKQSNLNLAFELGGPTSAPSSSGSRTVTLTIADQ